MCYWNTDEVFRILQNAVHGRSTGDRKQYHKLQECLTCTQNAQLQKNTLYNANSIHAIAIWNKLNVFTITKDIFIYINHTQNLHKYLWISDKIIYTEQLRGSIAISDKNLHLLQVSCQRKGKNRFSKQWNKMKIMHH